MSTLKLKGSTSGYVELTAPATAGDNTITLPTTAGTVAVKDASNNTEVGTGVTIGSPSSNVFTVSTNGSERVRVDSSGNFGVGVASPTAKFDVRRDDADGKIAEFHQSGGYGIDIGSSQSVAYISSGYLQDLVIKTDPSSGQTERVRVTNTGKIYINSATAPVVGTEWFGVNGGSDASAVGMAAVCTNRTGVPLFLSNSSDTTNTYLARFSTGSGGNTRGEIYYNGSQLVYATSSDYRLKENISDFTNGISVINQLRPVKYNWIENGNEDVGFIAHEVQEVFPNAVGGEKDAVDENGKIIPQTYDPSKIVPILTAALQESIIRIEALEAENATLKSDFTALAARVAALESA